MEEEEREKKRGGRSKQGKMQGETNNNKTNKENKQAKPARGTDEVEQAVKAGVLSNDREGAAVHDLDERYQQIFSKLDGRDVVKKGHVRKGRTCIILPGQIALKAAGGVIGTLEKLDTKKPSMYINFEKVRHIIDQGMTLNTMNVLTKAGA